MKKGKRLFYIKSIIAIACFLGVNMVSYGQNIIAESNPAITTDKLTSGGLVLGINRNAGGVINFLSIPGVGNIFGPQSVKYGRSGQSAMRDLMHGQRYNPTQAGFNETLGTPVYIKVSDGQLDMPARALALWYGDCKWDFAEWENLGADATCYEDNGHGDVDEMDESNLPGKQDTEVRSEFDYYGFYHDYKDKGSIDIACIRHYFEYRYIREPGHCLSQFRPGLAIFDDTQIHPDISTAFPQGIHQADPSDMSIYSMSWHIRNDVVKWDPKYQYLMNDDRSLTVGDRKLYRGESLDNMGNVVKPRLVIISKSDNADDPNALGFYMPNSDFNTYETVGVNETTGTIAYKDKRRLTNLIYDNPNRIPPMGLYGFKSTTKGLLNRTRLPENIYEAYRYDVFILMGSPNEIREAVIKIEDAPLSWDFETSLDNWTCTGAQADAKSGAVQLTKLSDNTVLQSANNLLVDPALHKFVSIRLKNNTAATKATLSFKKYGANTAYKHDFSIKANANTWQTYFINVSTVEDWEGMVNQLALEVSATSGSIDVDFITVSADNLIDCNGDLSGGAFEDACGECVGGNTGKEACGDCMGVTNGDAVLNGCGECVGGTSTLPIIHEWHFDDLDSWILNPRITGASAGGIASFDLVGTDPYLTCSEALCLDAKRYNTLELKVKNNTNGRLGTFYYQTDLGSGYKNVKITLSDKDTEIKTYTLDLSGEENWGGNINKIRFDPPGVSGTFEIDYIGLIADEVNAGVKTVIDNSDEALSLYPNPATSSFQVFTAKPSQIKVFDLLGKENYSTKSFKSEHTVNIDRWEAGLYLVQSMTKEGFLYSKTLLVD